MQSFTDNYAVLIITAVLLTLNGATSTSATYAVATSGDGSIKGALMRDYYLS